MNSNLIGQVCSRILRAYRQHFPLQGGGGYMEGDTLFFSFHHPQHTLFLSLTPSNHELDKRLTVNLICADNAISVHVDSTGIMWNLSESDGFTPEELQNLETLASRVYLIALDLGDELKELQDNKYLGEER